MFKILRLKNRYRIGEGGEYIPLTQSYLQKQKKTNKQLVEILTRVWQDGNNSAEKS